MAANKSRKYRYFTSTPYCSMSGSRSASIVCRIAPTVSSPGPATSIASPNSAPGVSPSLVVGNCVGAVDRRHACEVLGGVRAVSGWPELGLRGGRVDVDIAEGDEGQHDGGGPAVLDVELLGREARGLAVAPQRLLWGGVLLGAVAEGAHVSRE